MTARSAALTAEAAPVAALLLLGSLAAVNLTAMPMFGDEGSQLHLIYRAIEAHDWLAPLGTGKPLEAWPLVPLVWLGLPALAAMRAMHVLAGMLAAVLTYRLALRTCGRRSAWVSGVLVALCPFTVMLQRLALADMLLCAAAAWALLCSIAYLEAPDPPRAAALAVSLLTAALAKLPVGLLLAAAVPLALLFMPAGERAQLLRGGTRRGLLLAHLPVMTLAAAIAALALLRVHQGHTPGFGLQTVAGIGLGYYQGLGTGAGVSRPGMLSELAWQLSWPVVAAGGLGIIAAAWLGGWRLRWLAAAGLAPMLAIGYGAHFWFSRYLLFTLPPLIVTAVAGWSALLARAPRLLPVNLAVLLTCMALMGYQSALLILDPLAARWSPLDRSQYIENGGGYGYPEAARFIQSSTATPRMIFALEGYSAYQLRGYLPASWGARVRPVAEDANSRVLATSRERVDNLQSQGPAWIIVEVQLLDMYKQSVFGQDLQRINLRQVATFDRPGAQTQIGIYLATPASSRCEALAQPSAAAPQSSLPKECG